MKVFNRHVSGRSLTVFAFEVVLISGSIALAGEMYGISGSGAFLWRLVIVTALCQLTFYYNDLYDLTIVQSRRELIARLLQAAGSAAILIAVARVAFPSVTLDPRTFVTALSVFLIAVLTWRLAFNSLSRAPHLEERILILGTGPAARMLARQIGMRQTSVRLIDSSTTAGATARPPARHPGRRGRHRTSRRRTSGHVDRRRPRQSPGLPSD